MNKAAHFSMIRDFHLADWFTIANALCGMGAVLAVMAYLSGKNAQGLLWAAMLIPAAFLFDVCDGRIARWRQTQSALGRELDSLADVISFGVAPAAMAFGAGLNGFWDCLVLVYFAYHLAHFTWHLTGPQPTALNADGTFDAFSMLVKGFQQPLITLLYVVAQVLLAAHISHGIYSLFQHLGFWGAKWTPFLKNASLVVGYGLCAGFASIPLAVLLGFIKL